MSATVLGPIHWGGKGTDEGHLDLTITWRVLTTDPDDGPAIVGAAAGLPAIGSLWNFGNDSHPFARCLPGWEVERNGAVAEGSPSVHWTVKQTFSTRPVAPAQRSGDPLSRDPEVTGSFERYRKEVEFDRHGKRLMSVSFEPLQGEAREREFFHPVINITVIESTLDLAMYSEAMNSLNDDTLWGLPARHVQLTSFGWSEEKYGASKYYKIALGFRVDFEGFDKEAVNGGQLGLPPHITTQAQAEALIMTLSPPVKIYEYPGSYVPNRDKHGGVGVYRFLSEYGIPVDREADIVKKAVEHYDEFNMLLLGIPSSL
jgi:hypothetical protein